MNAVRSIVVGLLCLTAGMVGAAPLYQCPLTVNGYAEGKAALADFPVLVRISTAIDGFSYGDCAAGGADISFTSEDGKTVYPHEVDTWNPNGESLVWVKLPSMAHGTKFLFRWADQNPPANDPKTVWTDYVGVWHFNENGGLSAADSSPNGFHGSVLAEGADAADYTAVTVEGKTVGAGRQCTARSLSFTMPDYSTLKVGGNFTASGIFKMEARTAYESFFNKKQDWNVGKGFQCNMQNSDETFFICGSGSGKTYSNQKLPNVKINWTYLTLAYDGTSVVTYNMGAKVASFTIDDTGDVARDMTVAGFKGIVDEVRVRKGATSAEWVKAEYEVATKSDYLTAGTSEYLSTTVIAVSSDGLQYGVVSPAYGQITEPVAGTTYDFSCTVATQTLNEAKTTRAVCTGWELRKLSNGELIKSSSSEGERQFSCSHEYVQDEGVELKWRWQIQYLVTATAGTGGTVSPTEQWVDAGTTCAPITATANDGCGFYKWTGDVPAGGAGVNPLAFPVNEPLAVAASFGKCIYVALGGRDDAAGTEGAPYASIEKAVDSAGAGDIINVGEGTFALPTDLTLENTTGWKLRGAGIGKTILNGGGRHVVCFSINHAEAELCGFTLQNITWNDDNRKDSSACFNLSSGYLHDIAVTNVNCDKTGNMTGLGCYMKGGHMADMIFDSCHGNRTDMNINGSGVRQTAGLSERLVIRNCYGKLYGALYLSGGSNTYSKIYGNVARNSSAQGGGVTMTGGTLMNATIWGNGASTEKASNTGAMGGGLYHSGGVVTNCLVWGNSAPSQTAAGKPDWYTTKNATDQNKLIFNLCTTDAKGVNPIPYDPQLRDPENGDFSLLASSPCILEDGTTVGAVPYDRTKADAAMAVSPRTVFTTDAVTFTATTRNVANPAYSWTVTDATGAEVKTSSEASFSSTFDAGIYDVTLVVTDNGTPVATDVRSAYFRVHPLTNVVEKASDEVVATAELQDALENAPDGQVVIFGEGTWTLPNVTIQIDRNIKVFGAGVDKTTFRGGSRDKPCFKLTNSGAEMADFTLDNVTLNKDNECRDMTGIGFYLSAGFLHDCAITNINCDKTGNLTGIGVYMVGGHMADVLIDNCHGSRSDMNMNGSGLRQTAGLSERLIIRNCYGKLYGALYLSGGSNTYSRIYKNVARNSSAQGGGVTMTGGTLLHATIWGNGAGTDNANNTGAQGGGLYHSSGIVTNCIVWGNSAPSQSDSSTGKPDWYSTKESTASSYFFNFCSTKAIGVDPIASDPQFVDAENGDFSVQSSSPCIFETFTVGAVEYDRTQPDAAMTVSPVKTFDTETVEFTSTIQNIADPHYAWTVTDADGEIVKTSTEADFSATFDKGVYDIKLVVSDGDREVKTDERLGYLTIYAKTNTVAAGVKDALKDALADTFDGQVFLLEDGIHEVTATLTLDKDLKLIGGGMDKCIIKKTGSANRAILINNSEALVTGVAITGGGMGDSEPERYSWGLGVLIGDNGGTVSWCCITNNKTSSHFMRGGGVGMTGNGLVSHCIIADNSVQHLQADYGGGAALSNGRLENCLITGNSAIYGGGVALAGSGKVRNCTIVGNTASGGSGGLCWWNASDGSAKVLNCVFSGNSCDADTSRVKPNVGFVSGDNNKQAYMACSNSVSSCAYEGSALLGVGAVALSDPFENAAAGDYRLKLSSAAVNAGSDYDGLAELDLAAGPRVIGDVVDMGAYETDTDVFGASFAMDKTEALLGVAFTATATVNGTDDYGCEWTAYAPDGAAVKTFSGDSWTWTPETDGWYRVTMTVTDNEKASDPIVDDRSEAFYVAPARIDLAENASIHDALARALDGTKICLSAGEYVTTARVTITKGVVIEGPGYKRCTVRAGTNWVGDRRVFYLNHPKVTLRGMTITGGQMGTAQNGVGDTRNIAGGGVYIAINGGTVEDCRITGNRSGTYQNCGGGVGIGSAQGVVRNCIIDHNTVLCTSTQEYGGGAYLTAGVMSNCVIHSNVALDGGGVYFNGGALVANCTIVSNRATSVVGGVYLGQSGASAKVRDSIIWGNVDASTSPKDGTTARPEYGSWNVINNGNFNYCAFSEGTKLPTDDARNLMGEGNFTCNPGFKRFDKLDFRIKMFSPCDRVSSTGSWLGALEPYPAGLLLLVK